MESATDASTADGRHARQALQRRKAVCMLIPLELRRDQPLQQQLYEQLRALIGSARLRAGLRMPPTRALAEQFSISRNTVLLTYERLIAEGYLETLPAKGTFVARASVFRPAAHAGIAAEAPVPFATPDHGGEAVQIRVGRPDPSLFPAGRWRTLMRNALDTLGAQLGTEHPAGNPALRRAIADWLSSSRGLAVAPEQVILASGRQQARHLAAHLALRPGGRAVVEDPCDPDAAAVLSSESVELVRVPVDADGLRVDRLPAEDVALVHVTPEHQQPLGVALTAQRRVALLAWAGRIGALVLEEDCEGELRYGGRLYPSLMSLDTADRVLLLGGFCASLGPWLRLAYLVVPRSLVAAAALTRRLMDDGRHALEETALAGLLDSGGYARHVHRLGKAYASRRDALVDALQKHFGAPSALWGTHAGLHVSWFPPAGLASAPYLASVARRCGLDAATPHGDPRTRPAPNQPVLIGFGGLPERQICVRVAQFAAQAQASATALSAD